MVHRVPVRNRRDFAKMDLPVRNLVKRNEKFYFRCRIPGHSIQGTPKEFRLSLKTTDLKKAVITANLASEKVRSLIESGVMRMVPLEEMRRLIADYISRSLEDSERHLANFGRICRSTRDESITTHEHLISQLEKALADNNLETMTALNSAKSLLENIPHEKADENLMAREFLRAQKFLAVMQIDRLKGERFATEFNPEDYREILNGTYRPETAPASTQETLPNPVHTLKYLVGKYLEEKTPVWGKSMSASTEKVLETLMEVIPGNTDIKAIRHHNLLEFRDNFLLKMPVRRYHSPEMRSIPLAELIKDYKGETLSNKTVNIMTAKLGGFFIWCHNHEYIDRNPAVNLQLKLGHKASEERSPYSTEDLRKIFTNLRSDKLNAWAPHKLLIPLIALYSGARQNEICQLQLDNIINADGIACFQITEDEASDTRLKNANSKRIIPIHPTLLKLGFLGYVLDRCNDKRRRKTSDTRLWGTLGYKEKYGYSHDFQKFFSRFNRAYVTDDEKKVFHSLRHNFTNNLKQQGIAESIIAELVGHSIRSMTFSRYGKEFNPGLLLDTLQKLDYGIDIFAILGIQPLSEDVIAEQVYRLPRKA